MDCLFCKLGEEVRKYRVAEYRFWTLKLNPRQYYLGRVFLMLNRHEIDLTNLEQEEITELFQILKKVKKALIELFESDHFNYTFLGNTIHHLHLHIVPRYKEKKIFNGIEFIDEDFGKTYNSYKTRELSEETYKKLIETIREKISNIETKSSE